MTSFTLLDDSNASATSPTSRLYTDLHHVLNCTDVAQFSEVIDQLNSALRQGYYAVAVFSYELGAQLHGVGLNAVATQPSHILLYRQCQWLNADQVAQWLQQQVMQQAEDDESLAGIADLRASVNQNEFTRAIERIQRYIADGDTYQVNYTFRLHFQTYGTIFSLYQRLRQRQPVPFGALIALPDGSAILSLSPELFIRHSQGKVSVCPMKGTSAAAVTHDAHLNEQINAQRAEQLAWDEKNRAENVMIVDLLRNDLGRIAQPGSVQVSKLFEVQRFNRILQMTSSVTAQCRTEVNLADLLSAVYPCGSITGAPKIRTMQIIHEVETEQRGIYTGAIGWFDPYVQPGCMNKIPEFCLSVPIRTLHLQTPKPNGMRSAVMGVGAGIVFDSVAESEYQECQLKAQFLTELPAQFALFETMYATKEHGCRHWERHRNRLMNSARYFGVPLNLAEIEQQLMTTCAALIDKTPYRLKLSVDGIGQIQIQYTVLALIPVPINVLLATTPQKSHNCWLQHKTTQRAKYDRAWQTAEAQGAFDTLFCNEHGHVTEGGRSNLLVKLEGRWYTPPLSAGVLPGVMREVLMEDPAWQVTERSITLDQLIKAEEIALCNALRGVLPAQLIGRI